jgi:Tol biopolymer transport system component
MVFCSNQPHEQDGNLRGDHDFWVSERDGDSWSAPEVFAPAALSDFEDYYPIITRSGNLYFNSQREGAGTNNIFRSSQENGQYGPATKLPEPVNSEYREFDAYVSPEEGVIIFSSERPGGFGGADIYVSFLEANGNWAGPQNLGEEVNSSASEYGAMPSPDGRYLFFTSGRGGDENIYWISMEIVNARRLTAGH